MSERVNDLFDIIMIILILSVAFSTGYVAVVKTNQEMQHYESPYADKNTSPRYSDNSVYNARNAVSTQGELIIMAAVQDVGITGSEIFTFDGTVTKVQFTGRVLVNGMEYTSFTTTGATFLTYTPDPDPTNPFPESKTVQMGTLYPSMSPAPGNSIVVNGIVFGPDGTAISTNSAVTMYVMENSTLTATVTNGYIDVDLLIAAKEKKDVVMQQTWNAIRGESKSTGFLHEYCYDISIMPGAVMSGTRFRFYPEGIINPDGTVN